MKIVIATKSVYPFHPVGGVQKYVYNLAKYLIKENVDVEIIAPLDTGKARTEIYEGIKYTFLWPSIFWYLEYPIGWLGVHLFSYMLSKYLKNKQFDLLHSFDMTGYQYLKVKNRRPVIAQIFTDNYLTNPISFRNPLNIASFLGHKLDDIKKKKIKISPFADQKTIWQYPIQYFLKVKPMHFSLRRSDAVFLEEEVFKKEVVDLFDLNSQKCDTLPLGVDISFITERMKNSFLARTDIGLDKDDLVLITVNRLAADKGVDKIIVALGDIINEIPKVKLIIVGDGYQKKELLKLISDKNLKGNVLCFDKVSEEKLYGFYGISDIYVSAFSYPGSSMSTLEAMACGLPIVTTAQPWLVLEGKNGIVLESNEPSLIQKAVLGLAKNNRLKENGKISKEIASSYDWGHIAKMAVKKYEKII